MSQKLRKIMVDHVVTVDPSATAKKAAELMNLHDIGCLIVVHSRKPVGILTERDMLKRVVHASKDAGKTIVVDIMSKPIVTASPNMRAGDAAKLMFERSIKKLPVVENGQLVGVVSLTDLLRSEGVIQFLNKDLLNGASDHIRKVANLYSDSSKLHRRKCPLTMNAGYQMGCVDNRCMWWTGNECAVTKLARRISGEPEEAEIAQQQSCID